MHENLDRREFMHFAVGALVCSATLTPTRAAVAAERSSVPSGGATYVDKIGNAPRLFCVAYITPDAPGQGGQEAMVAKYPLALVPQDTRAVFVQWRDRVRRMNPSIMLLGYQMVIEETTVPGPGHDELRKIRDAYCVYPGGFVPTVTVAPSTKHFRIFDPRSSEWQAKFLDACRAVLRSYPYAGLFLDNCTVYDKAHPLPSVREDMRRALQQALLVLRGEHPDILIVGNSSFKWRGLNGEMVEARPDAVSQEVVPFPGHAEPTLELVQALIGSATDTAEIARQMAAAHARGAFFAAAVDYQHVLWFEQFDEVVASRTQGAR
jgi:hypothetical protein